MEQSRAESDEQSNISQQELDIAHEVAISAVKLETDRVRKVGAFANLGMTYAYGHISSSVYGSAKNEIVTSVTSIDKKLGTTYRAAERKARQSSARSAQVDSDIEALKRRS